MKRPFGVSVLAATIGTALLASGCATNLSGSGLPTTSAEQNLPPVEASQELFDKLPAGVRARKTITVGTSPNYKPVEFLEGSKVSGLDVDLFNAAAARMGVSVQWKESPFDQILIGIQAKKYDAGVSAFTVTPERTKTVNMVSYLNAGSLWVVQKGNPKQVTPNEPPCGRTVAVQIGVVQEMEMKAMQAKCGSRKINLLSFTDQGEATTALISGRADMMAADSPISLYAIKMSGDTLEPLGESYDTAPYGIVLRKDQPEFAEAVRQAYDDLKASGHYDQILATWNQTDGAIDAFEVNPS
ncbi:ABC transporter substrate-binding protein [Luteococcus sp. Sow4_B9]|uniref:ABC transporter substrate-binding protein n=1 Tax=Luteococcus sp. Sow4_B9 TaxID=3438792 RepID=UPI003F9C8743